MASNTSLKFYKFSNHETSAANITTAKAVDGAIIYIVDTHELWVGGTNPQLALKGASEVSFANNMLTVKTYDATGTANTQTLDFSDTASASATLKVFEHMNDLIGVVEDSSKTPATTKLDYAGANYISTQTTLTGADKRLDAEIKTVWDAVQTAGKVDDVKIGTQSIVTNKVAVFETDELYDASTNKIATVQTVTDAINALDVTDSMGDASISGSTITIQGVKQTDGKIIDGDVTTINLDGTYDETTNKIATQGTVASAINALDANSVGGGSISGSTITIQGVQQTNGVISGGSETTINLEGTYDASNNKIATQSTVSTAVTSAIEALDTQSDVHDVVYTAASGNDGAKLTFKGVSETDGIIAQGGGTTELQFAKVATTGSADDVTIGTGVHYANQTVSATVQDITNRVIALEELPDFDTIVSSDAATTPAGVTWDDQGTTVTGTLVASATTMHKIYLVPTDGTTPNVYREYITLHNGNAYSWEKIGDTEVDLTGYAKSVTVNGHQYTAGSGTDINIGNVITSVNGDTAISGGNSKFVAVTATTSAAASGAQEVTLTSTVKLQSVSGASSSTQGLAEASDVKDYVDTQIDNLDKGSTTQDGTNVHVTYSETNGIVSLDTITEDYATITRTAKASGVAPNLVVTSGDENKLVKASNIADVKAYADDKITDEIEKLDANITSDDAAVASVEVVETNGKITDVVVTNISAGVQYTAASGGTPANLAASTSTGAVTGADIAAIKNYVDTHSSSVSDGAQTLTVNDANMSTLATVDGTPITAKVSLVWEEYV